MRIKLVNPSMVFITTTGTCATKLTIINRDSRAFKSLQHPKKFILTVRPGTMVDVRESKVERGPSSKHSGSPPGQTSPGLVDNDLVCR